MGVCGCVWLYLGPLLQTRIRFLPAKRSSCLFPGATTTRQVPINDDAGSIRIESATGQVTLDRCKIFTVDGGQSAVAVMGGATLVVRESVASNFERLFKTYDGAALTIHNSTFSNGDNAIIIWAHRRFRFPI